MTTTLSDADWLEAIVEKLDYVGWTTGTTYDTIGKQCLIGAAAAVEGVDYSTLRHQGMLMIVPDEIGIIENDVAERLSNILNLDGSTWIDVTNFNDGFKTWESLRQRLVDKIEELRNG